MKRRIHRYLTHPDLWPWGRQYYFQLKQQHIWPPKLETVAEVRHRHRGHNWDHLEKPPWKEVSIDTLRNPDQRPLGPLKLQLTKTAISSRQNLTQLLMVSLEASWKDASIEPPHTLNRGPWGRRHHIDTPSPSKGALSTFRQIGWSHKACRERLWWFLKRHILMAVATHDLPLWNEVEKN